jgi:hypothetical protein
MASVAKDAMSPLRLRFPGQGANRGAPFARPRMPEPP